MVGDHAIAIRTFAFLFAIGLMAGCESTDGQTAAATKSNDTAAAQLAEAKTETKEAAQAMQDYAYAQKAEFIEKMNEELVDMQAELDQLSAILDRPGDAGKADAEASLEMVREKWTQAKDQLDRAADATESTWNDVQGDFKKTHRELKDSLDKTRQWLSDKLEP